MKYLTFDIVEKCPPPKTLGVYGTLDSQNLRFILKSILHVQLEENLNEFRQGIWSHRVNLY